MATGRSGRGAPLVLLALALGLVVSLLAWRMDAVPQGTTTTRALYELERMALLPSARVQLLGFGPRDDRWIVPAPLLLDRFEVTRADWEHYLGPPESDPGWTLPEAAWYPDRVDWPAYLTLEQARVLAEARGMRLPSGLEWVYAAVGESGHPYPWGSGEQQSIANTIAMKLDRPTPVGSFESGRSAFGCYDLVGNLREWVEGSPPPAIPDPDANPTRGYLFGGSYRDHLRPVFQPGDDEELAFSAAEVDVGSLDVRNGVRHCADAREYLWDRAADWGTGEDAQRRLHAIGRGWMLRGGTASGEILALLEELAARPGAPAGLTWLMEGARGP